MVYEPIRAKFSKITCKLGYNDQILIFILKVYSIIAGIVRNSKGDVPVIYFTIAASVRNSGGDVLKVSA